MNKTMCPGRSVRWARALILGTAFLATGFPVLHAQTPVAVGGGSYASSVPANQNGLDAYYGLSVDQVLQYYNSGLLHLDAAKYGTVPLPTNHWWTDLLFGDRSYIPEGGTRTIVQDNYGGQQWFYPGMIDPKAAGLDVYFPNAWVTGTTALAPQGNFNTGTALPVEGTLDIAVGAGDVLIANFEGTALPAGWTNTGGTGFGSGPVVGGSYAGQSPQVAGFVGNACVNSFNGGDTGQGTLTSPNFTINKRYLSFLVGGGNNNAATYVGLSINNNVVLRAAGQNDATLRWVTWDLQAYQGQTAQIRIVDSTGAGWGFILADFLVLTDNGGDPALRYTSTFSAQKTFVTNWGDWSVDFALRDTSGRAINTTMLRGTPFTWTRWINGVKPAIRIGAGTPVYNGSQGVISTAGGSFTATNFSFDYQGKSFGVFLPTNTVVNIVGDALVPQLSGANNYMVIGYLPNKSYLNEFATYAYAHPTNSALSWNYSRTAGTVATTFTVTTESWQGGQTQTLLGWLPHHYRNTTSSLAFKAYSYLTPRGVMKVTPGTAGTVTYKFRGIVPMLPPPKTLGVANDYQVARMNTYINNFVPGHPGTGPTGDTYWSGKDLAITAQFVGFATQLQNASAFSTLKQGVTSEMQNWLTYTPGEPAKFFARLDGYRSMQGFQCSYGSGAFSDNHFHYGYYTLAAGLLGMHDAGFIASYGPMARLVAKQYANWDRTDTNFPFLRTFDAWEGHSNAGGTSSGGGENQESSSEAINSWVGMFLLGAQLNDDAMIAAGAMGYAVENTAVNEYWQNMYGGNLPSNYYVFGSNATMVGIVGSGGSAYGTFFSGDPAWIFGIQNTPPNHWNHYLVNGNKAFATAQLNTMYSERQQISDHNTPLNNPYLFTLGSNPNNASGMGEGLGNVILGWQALFDPAGVAALMDQYFAANSPTATANTNPGVTYYLAHAIRGLGDPDPNYYTSMPTSACYFNAATGQRYWIIYNYLNTTQTVTQYNNGAVVGTVSVPARSFYTNYTTMYPLDNVSTVGVNLALNKPVTVSSTENAGTPGSAAVDNSTTTRWSSLAADPQWIQVDLQGTYNVSEVRLNWETAAGKDYVIEVSANGSTWNNMKTVTGNTTAGSKIYTGLSGSGRYVRIYGTARATAYGYSLWDFQVYGSLASAGTNLALGKTATASSAITPAGNAFDGNAGTRWESAQGVDPQWIQVDLGATRTVSSIKLNWETAAGKDYKVQISAAAGGPWTDMVTVTGNTTGGEKVYGGLNYSGRYVRMNGTARATQWGYSLWEFEVIGQ
jgi:endoglucanase Acf2